MLKRINRALANNYYLIPVLGIFTGLTISFVYFTFFKKVQADHFPDSVQQLTINDKIEDASITLVAVGDVMLGRKVNEQTVSKNNFRWAFEKTADILKSADITMINLEGTLIANCPITQTNFYFCGGLGHIEGLNFAGVDIANLANNHSYNYGKDGLRQTIENLEKSGIAALGIGKAVYKEISGTKFAFLGYNDITLKEPGISWADNDRVKSEVGYSSQNSDITIVTFHWGVEYTDKPTDRQVTLAHLAIDAGADLVIGHHPHWTQTAETYKKKLIVYSLGNFIFDQMWSTKTREGEIAKFTFLNQELTDYELLPVFIEDFGQPRLVN